MLASQMIKLQTLRKRGEVGEELASGTSVSYGYTKDQRATDLWQSSSLFDRFLDQRLPALYIEGQLCRTFC